MALITVVVVAIVSPVLLLIGVSVAYDFRGAAARVAVFISGTSRGRSWTSDRLWSVPLLSLAVGLPLSIAVSRVNDTVGGFVGAAAAGIYIALVMWLAWIYTPQSKRRIGPLFWTMRSAAIPAAIFFGYCGLILLTQTLSASW